MNDTNLRALLYVANTEGGATPEDFISDHEPIGEILWHDLYRARDMIEVSAHGKIFLTKKGKRALKED